MIGIVSGSDMGDTKNQKGSGIGATKEEQA